MNRDGGEVRSPDFGKGKEREREQERRSPLAVWELILIGCYTVSV